MFRLTINNERVELSDKAKLQLSRLIIDISDVSKRGINISNAINLPFTERNDRLTGFPSRLNSNNSSFEDNQTYALTQQNNIISTGDVVIKSFDEKKGIKIQLAEGFGFWSLIGRRKMNDLTLFQYDEILENATASLLENKTDSPWLWALTDFENNDNTTVLNNTNFSRPQYRHRILLDKIIEEAGFSIDYTNLLSITNIDDIGSISNSQDFSLTDNRRIFEGVAVPAGEIPITGGVVEFAEAGNVQVVGNGLNNQLYATSYIIKGVVNANFDTKITISYTLGAVTNSESVNVPKGRSFVNFRTEEIEIDSDTVFSVSSEVTLESVRIYSHMNETDLVEIEGRWRDVRRLDYQMLTDYNLPEMTQAEFFKTLIKQLFLKVDVDVLKKVVTLRAFSDILSTNNAIDLTGKSQKFPPYSSGKSFGQLNLLTYNNDDSISENIGRATFNIDNKNSVPSKMFVEIGQFSASREKLVDDNTTINAHIYDVTDKDTRISISNRIVEFNVGIGIAFTASFSGVSWNSIYSNYYIDFVNAIKRERVMKVKALLSFLDFKRINEKPIVYFDELNSYFMVLNISGFQEGEFTNLDMVKFV